MSAKAIRAIEKAKAQLGKQLASVTKSAKALQETLASAASLLADGGTPAKKAKAEKAEKPAKKGKKVKAEKPAKKVKADKAEKPAKGKKAKKVKAEKAEKPAKGKKVKAEKAEKPAKGKKANKLSDDDFPEE